MRQKKTVSLKKLEANRRNALRSTGPRTLRGKSTAAFNAVKSGIFAKHVLITSGDGKEDEAEFQKLCADLHKQFRPEGALEAVLVETIATCVWRRRRVLRYERGEVRKRLDSATCEDQRRLSNESLRQLDHVSMFLLRRETQDNELAEKLWQPVPEFYEITRAIRESSHGLQYLIEMLKGFRTEIEKKGNIDDDLRMLLAVHFVSDTDKFFLCVWKCSKMIDKATKPENAEDPDLLPRELFPPETCQKMMLTLIDVQIRTLTERKSIAERNETLAREASLEAFSLPSDQATNVVLRYAAAIDREFYRALNQLERLQRQRSGELLPAPINLNLTAGA